MAASVLVVPNKLLRQGQGRRTFEIGGFPAGAGRSSRGRRARGSRPTGSRSAPGQTAELNLKLDSKDAGAQEQDRPGLRVVRVMGARQQASGGGGLLLWRSGCASAPPRGGEDDRADGGRGLGVRAVAKSGRAPSPSSRSPVHVGDTWWAFRAEFLKMNEGSAKDRDNEISEKQAPGEFWDQQSAVETISIWTTFCNECHGGRRRMEDVVKMPGPGRQLGEGRGSVLRHPAALRRHLQDHLQRQDREGGQPLEDARLAREAVQGTDLGVDLLRRVPVGRHRRPFSTQPVSARKRPVNKRRQSFGRLTRAGTRFLRAFLSARVSVLLGTSLNDHRSLSGAT